MPADGLMIIAGEETIGLGAPFRATDAAAGVEVAPDFRTASAEQVDSALAAAGRAAIGFGDSPPAARAALLEAIAEQILAIGDALIERAMIETGLPRARLEGERIRTVNQLRLFATHLREGDFAGVRIDRAQPDRPGAPKPDLRLSLIALGPVAVFGASNFPLAFSVAGGDTASALAAGCPVIVKGHPAHPGTGELMARAVAAAVRESDFDPGIFSMLQDGGIAVGQALAADSRIKAIGFTGSRRAGEALIKIAAERLEPIPVYAEMSAINPVLLLPARLNEAAEAIASAFVGSLTLGVGQFCTNPGLIIAVEGQGLERFIAAAAAAMADWTPGTMLTPGICRAYAGASGALSAETDVALLAAGTSVDQRAQGKLFATRAHTFLANAALHQEMFGPAALIVRCADLAEMHAVLAEVEGQLTIAMHFADADHDAVLALLPIARRKAGRVLANGFGTGVEVSPAMVHGGPYPATSDSRSTSVGTRAIERFLRPVCLQDFPQALLPEAVSDRNPFGLPRRIW
jgi:NADP-dependent aldehyde dehydrogenase